MNEALRRGIRTFFQTLGGSLIAVEVTLNASFLRSLATAAVGAAVAGVAAVGMNLSDEG